jgi:hypothetical protein
MHVHERRQVADRIAEALFFLRGEATAATLDQVAAAIWDAELSIVSASPDRRPLSVGGACDDPTDP